MSSIQMRLVPSRSSKFGRNAKDDTSKLEFTLTGAPDKASAEAHALASLPPRDAHRTLNTFTVKELVDHRDGHWRVIANYKGPTIYQEADVENPVIKEISVGFAVGNQSKFMSHSLETIATHQNPFEPTPDFETALNVVDGVPQGVDVSPQQMAEFNFTVEQEVPTVMITNAWIKQVQDATNKVNNADFRGRAAGEVLFYGLRGTVKLKEAYTPLTWEFLGAENKTGQTVGGFTGVDKKGWEYAWVYSEEREKQIDANTKKIVHTPIALYVERLFETIDMTTTFVNA